MSSASYSPAWLLSEARPLAQSEQLPTGLTIQRAPRTRPLTGSEHNELQYLDFMGDHAGSAFRGGALNQHCQKEVARDGATWLPLDTLLQVFSTKESLSNAFKHFFQGQPAEEVHLLSALASDASTRTNPFVLACYLEYSLDALGNLAGSRYAAKLTQKEHELALYFAEKNPQMFSALAPSASPLRVADPSLYEQRRPALFEAGQIHPDADTGLTLHGQPTQARDLLDAAFRHPAIVFVGHRHQAVVEQVYAQQQAARTLAELALPMLASAPPAPTPPDSLPSRPRL